MNDNSKCSTIGCKCSTLAFIFQGHICAKHAQVLKNVAKFESSTFYRQTSWRVVWVQGVTCACFILRAYLWKTRTDFEMFAEK